MRLRRRTGVGGVGQEAGAADAGRQEVWGRVLALVALLSWGALPAGHRGRPVLRVGEPPDGQRALVVKAQLL